MGGSRAQVNKPHKTRFASKSSRNLHKTSDKSRIGKSEHNVAKGARAARVQRNKMLREQKRAALLKEKRASSGSASAPRVIVLFGLSADVNLNSLAEDLLSLLSPQGYDATLPTVASVEYKLRTTVLKAPHGDLLSCLEMAKVADLIAFVASASSSCEGSTSDYIDSFGSHCLSVFRSLGLPSTAVLIRDLPTDMKRRHDSKKTCTSSLASEFPEDCKFYPADTKDELHKFMWLFKEQRLSVPHWRSQRPYLISQKVDMVADDFNLGNCTLLLTGYLRARSLSVNQLVHVSGVGDFQLSKMEILKDPFPLNARKEQDFMESDEVCDVEVLRSLVPDPMRQEPLLVENVPDPLAGEQTWPTEAEMAEAEKSQKQKKKKKRTLPRGTSEYQAAWIVDGTDEEGSSTDEDEECKLKKIDQAFELLRSMALKGLEPNLISYNVVINGLCREGRMNETSQVLEEMKRKGFVPDEVTCNTLISGYCKEDNFHQALVLQEEMRRNGLSPNVVTYTALINAMCKAKNLNRAMEFFDQMRVRGLRPNQRTYTTLIDGFSQQGFLNEAYDVLKEMTGNGFSPSVVTYNALINGYCLLGRMEDAIGILQDMTGKGLSPDVVSYSTIITGFCRHQELESAFRMKLEMVEKGVSPDAVTYSSLIQGVCQQRRLVEACDLFKEMLCMGMSPDEFTYTTLINAYCVEGDLNKALQLNDEMIQKGFLPDVVTYSVLINGLNKQARTREAKRLLLKLFYEESVPDGVTYNTLIENCTNGEFKSVVALVKGFCMKGLMNEADQVFETMVERRHKPNEAVYDVIIHGHCKSGNVQKAYNLYKEMLHSGFVPHTMTVIALVKALFTEGMNNELSQVIGNTLRSCQLSDAELAKLLVDINHKEGNMDEVFNVLSDMAKDGLLPNSGVRASAGG